MLLGTVGELDTGTSTGAPAAHAFLEEQCVSCHMQTKAAMDDSHPGVTGHKFRVETFDLCLACHPFPELFVDFTRSAISARLQEVKTALDLWGATKSPEALRTKYGSRAWEYTNPGELSGTGPAPSPISPWCGRFGGAPHLYRLSTTAAVAHNGPHAFAAEAAGNWATGIASKLVEAFTVHLMTNDLFAHQTVATANRRACRLRHGNLVSP
jgi:hypothetical protein